MTATRRHGTSATAISSPANLYNVDYSLLGTARIEPLIRRIRNAMAGAGLEVENSKGECNSGSTRSTSATPMRCAAPTTHSIYKNAAKEIAAQEGMSISYIAKFDEREGNSCHIHFSLADAEGPLFARDRAVFESFLAGQLACLRELTLLLAPNVNSYKRYRGRLVRPDGGRLGARQPHLLAACRRPRRRAAVREPRRRC